MCYIHVRTYVEKVLAIVLEPDDECDSGIMQHTLPQGGVTPVLAQPWTSQVPILIYVTFKRLLSGRYVHVYRECWMCKH